MAEVIDGTIGSILTILGVLAFALSISGLVLLALASLKNPQRDKNKRYR